MKCFVASCFIVIGGIRLFDIRPMVLLKESASPLGARKVVVIGSVFRGPGTAGDFKWMIERREYDRSLFIFNDNEEQFDAFVGGDCKSGWAAGVGNAAIRPYQCASFRRAAGAPTGSRGSGYSSLTEDVMQKIYQPLSIISKLFSTGDYGRVFLSLDPERATLGTGIFRVGDDVRDYIYRSLMNIKEVFLIHIMQIITLTGLLSDGCLESSNT